MAFRRIYPNPPNKPVIFVRVSLVCINNFMNVIKQTPVKDRLSHKQHQYLQEQRQDTFATDKWIQDFGLNCNNFAVAKLQVLKALHIAHELLADFGDVLDTRDAQILRDFQSRANSTKQLARITDRECYDLMNFAFRFRRKQMIINKRKRKFVQSLRTNTQTPSQI